LGGVIHEDALLTKVKIKKGKKSLTTTIKKSKIITRRIIIIVTITIIRTRIAHS